MNTLSQSPYRNITPEELHLAMQRAHAERAKALRGIFASLLAWRRKVADRWHAAALKAAGSH